MIVTKVTKNVFDETTFQPTREVTFRMSPEELMDMGMRGRSSQESTVIKCRFYDELLRGILVAIDDIPEEKTPRPPMKFPVPNSVEWTPSDKVEGKKETPTEIYSIAGKGMVLLSQVLAAGIVSKTLHAVFQTGNGSKKMIVSFESEDEARTELAKLTSMVEAWHHKNRA